MLDILIFTIGLRTVAICIHACIFYSGTNAPNLGTHKHTRLDYVARRAPARDEGLGSRSSDEYSAVHQLNRSVTETRRAAHRQTGFHFVTAHALNGTYKHFGRCTAGDLVLLH